MNFCGIEMVFLHKPLKGKAVVKHLIGMPSVVKGIVSSGKTNQISLKRSFWRCSDP